jgi:Fibronectin type III domain
LKPLVERCMAKNPADRPGAKQFLADLVAAHPEAAYQADWLPESIRAEVGQRIQVPPPAREMPTPHVVTSTRYWKPEPEREEQASAPGADRTRTSSPPAASSPAPAGKPPRKPWRSRRRIWIPVGIAAVVAALGTVIGVLVAPSAPAPLLQPTGLSALKETETSVTLAWHAYTSGSQPTEYEILENSQNLVSVSGHQTKYQVNGLSINTAYDFSVIAVAGAVRSEPSATITVNTAKPPPPSLAGAAFNWSGTANIKETASSDTLWKRNGDTWQDEWDFFSNCGQKACAKVTLQGAVTGVGFTATLVRSGATYTGTAAIDNYWLDCLQQNKYAPSTLSIKLTATHEGLAYGAATWTVTAFTGTATWNQPWLPDGCAGSTYQMHVSSASL